MRKRHDELFPAEPSPEHHRLKLEVPRRLYARERWRPACGRRRQLGHQQPPSQQARDVLCAPPCGALRRSRGCGRGRSHSDFDFQADRRHHPACQNSDRRRRAASRRWAGRLCLAPHLWARRPDEPTPLCARERHGSEQRRRAGRHGPPRQHGLS